MSVYRPSHVPDPKDTAAFQVWVQDELERIATALNTNNDFIRLKVLHAPPGKMFGGMVVYADGTDWKPDTLKGGMFRRNEANTAWVFIA